MAKVNSTEIRRTAVAIVKALKDEPEGRLTSDFDAAILRNGGDPTVKQDAAALLREYGIPVVAQRARHLSRWFLAPLDSPKYVEWAERITQDAYSETCRAHQALVGKPGRTAVVRSLKSSAVALGTELGHDLDIIKADLTPTPMPPALAEFLSEYV